MKQAILPALLALCFLIPPAVAGEGEREHHDRGRGYEHYNRPYERWHRFWSCDYYGH